MAETRRWSPTAEAVNSFHQYDHLRQLEPPKHPMATWYNDPNSPRTSLAPGSQLARDHPRQYPPTAMAFSHTGSINLPVPSSPSIQETTSSLSTQETTSSGDHTPPRTLSLYKDTSPYHPKSRSSSPGLFDGPYTYPGIYPDDHYLPTSWPPVVTPRTLERRPPPRSTRTRRRRPTFRRQRLQQHDRPFQCVFLFAGCKRTFATKNEWKRHVSTMHIQNEIWRCDVPTCQGRKQTVFNRKDLFGQHIKRMHAPSTDNEKPQFLQVELPRIQDRCRLERRRFPEESVCGFCNQSFTGPQSWGERMEHVGRHYENATASGEDVSADRWRRDEGLIRWAVRERIVVERGGGEYALVGMGKEAVMEAY